MRYHTPSGNEVSTRSEPYTAATREMRMVDPTLPRYGTDLMTLQNELLHTLSRWWDLRTRSALCVGRIFPEES